ncbi:hypothetical protein GUJ93_ZPchr0005g14788 [Zizania palustris]|uniref:Uncharacterized protein n=1 Tax=Zizania palustris TaxID=103762 RepID=A0A8J5VRS2_ZIZPA|nr:hypothetical protein GUJ93_ZPchr0005g14788 [Zizania palustris]
MYAAEWVTNAKNKPVTCSELRPSPTKNRLNEVKYSFDVTKCDKIFDFLLKSQLLRLPKGQVIPPADELKKHPYCKWHDSHSHNTNDCNVFRRQIQSAIEEG